MTFLDLFSLGFMQRALIAALLTGLAAPAIGTFLVQRRLAREASVARVQNELHLGNDRHRPARAFGHIAAGVPHTQPLPSLGRVPVIAGSGDNVVVRDRGHVHPSWGADPKIDAPLVGGVGVNWRAGVEPHYRAVATQLPAGNLGETSVGILPAQRFTSLLDLQLEFGRVVQGHRAPDLSAAPCEHE